MGVKSGLDGGGKRISWVCSHPGTQVVTDGEMGKVVVRGKVGAEGAFAGAWGAKDEYCWKGWHVVGLRMGGCWVGLESLWCLETLFAALG